MVFYDVEQGSDSWFELRKGRPTASNFKRILTPKGKLSAQADDYIAEIIGERFSLIPPEHVESYTNRSMRWGAITEEEARRFYCMERGTEVTNGGFCMDDEDRFGASPDFLVGEDGAGELKCVQPGTQVRYLLDGVLPPEHFPQTHGHLIVTGRKYVDWLSYCPGLPPLLIRVVPSAYTRELRVALEIFWEKYQSALARVKSL